MEKIIIVDENDNEIGVKERQLLGPNDIYRVSALWLTNSRGEVLLAQRSLNKVHSPGKWGPAVAGTLAEGETYKCNIIKETEEEIGLISLKLLKSIYYLYDAKPYKKHCANTSQPQSTKKPKILPSTKLK